VWPAYQRIAIQLEWKSEFQAVSEAMLLEGTLHWEAMLGSEVKVWPPDRRWRHLGMHRQLPVLLQ
jgi:hypothetical protein